MAISRIPPTSSSKIEAGQNAFNEDAVKVASYKLLINALVQGLYQTIKKDSEKAHNASQEFKKSIEE